MTNITNNRIDLLKDLIMLNRPLDNIIDELKHYPWDSDELVIFSGNHLRLVLERYISGELSDKEVENWANALECRDDIGISNSKYDLIKDIIYELSNPILTQPLSINRAKDIVFDIS